MLEVRVPRFLTTEKQEVKLKEGTGYVIEECDAKAGEVKFKQFV
jgi:hypothetical protein